MIAAPQSLTEAIQTVESHYPITVLPADINGSRWAFSGSAVDNSMHIALSHRIRLSDTVGVIVYNWAALTQDAQSAVEQQLRGSL
jgi:hypothetical protein